MKNRNNNVKITSKIATQKLYKRGIIEKSRYQLNVLKILVLQSLSSSDSLTWFQTKHFLLIL